MRTRAAMDKPSTRTASRKAKALVQETEAPASILFASALGDAQKDHSGSAKSAATRQVTGYQSAWSRSFRHS